MTGGATISGNLQVQGLRGTPSGADNYLCDTSVGGNVQVQGDRSGAPVDLGDLGACSGGPGLVIGGNLQVQGNAASVTAGGNTVTGNIQVRNNTGGGTLAGNQARRELPAPGRHPADRRISELGHGQQHLQQDRLAPTGAAGFPAAPVRVPAAPGPPQNVLTKPGPRETLGCDERPAA